MTFDCFNELPKDAPELLLTALTHHSPLISSVKKVRIPCVFLKPLWRLTSFFIAYSNIYLIRQNTSFQFSCECKQNHVTRNDQTLTLQQVLGQFRTPCYNLISGSSFYIPATMDQLNLIRVPSTSGSLHHIIDK